MTKKIGIAFFYHESHSFTPQLTEIEDFKKEAYLKGDEIIPHYQGTKTEVGGFIDALSEYEDLEIVPILCAAAIPSGVVSRACYDQIEKDMLESLDLDLDGLLLALHGAMVVEGIEDPEELLLSKISAKIGPETPIAVTLDLHANLSAGILDYTQLLFGFKTYPHIDMYERGIDAAEAMVDVLSNGTCYYANMIQMPMLLPSLNMTTTGEGPMAEMIELAAKHEEKPILNVSIFGGFPYADTQTNTASIIVVGTEIQKVHELLEDLADAYWSKRDQFIVDLPTVDQAFNLYETKNWQGPVVFADISDNPLSCGSGDTTQLIRKLIEKNLPDTLFGGIYDPESLQKCIEVGEGGSLELEIGGKVSPEFGQPVKVHAEVIKLTEGIFRNSGPMNHNLRVDLLGAAHIKVGQVDGVLIGRAMSANDPEMFRHLGIEPTEKKLLCMKVKNHFRAAFEPLVEEIIYVDAPGVATNNLTNLTYQRRDKSVWPFKKRMDWREYDDKKLKHTHY